MTGRACSGAGIRASIANRAGSGAAASHGGVKAGCLLTTIRSPGMVLLRETDGTVLRRCSTGTEHKEIRVAEMEIRVADRGNHSEEGGVNGCTIFS